mmetsp:Transcript_25565/g.61597  ORF Transcript_25565/g.61597 Transcript_25565/m.61597 type:complete len:125 (-) Transcript_25565:106-480(-)
MSPRVPSRTKRRRRGFGNLVHVQLVCRTIDHMSTCSQKRLLRLRRKMDRNLSLESLFLTSFPTLEGNLTNELRKALPLLFSKDVSEAMDIFCRIRVRKQINIALPATRDYSKERTYAVVEGNRF